MFIDIIPTPGDFNLIKNIDSKKIVVVIDILRVASTIVTAFHNGCQRIYPVKEIKDAFSLKDRLMEERGDPEKILLGGEREGKKIEGFDLGNSPLEYTRETVEGKWLILSSTNGTSAMDISKPAGKIVIGSFLNAEKVAKYLEQQGKDVIFLLSGKLGTFSLEDAVGAGAIISYLPNPAKDNRGWNLNSGKGTVKLSDSGMMCVLLYQRFQNNLHQCLDMANHALYLKSIGLEKDLPFCACLNRFPILPLKEGNQEFLIN